MKTALVTGSARGIGRAICEELARSGVAQNIVVCDVQKEWCEETVAALRAIEGVQADSLALDVSKEASVVAGVAEAAKLFGSLDIVVNNAGVTRDDLLVRMTEEKWDTVLDINLKGAFLVTREAAKLMMRARSGAIVNIASVVGLMGNAGQANYSASKGGLIALTKTTARELGGRGVRVNAVAPGFINSKMTRERRRPRLHQQQDDGGPAGRREAADALDHPAQEVRRGAGHCEGRRVPLLRQRLLHHRAGDQRERRHAHAVALRAPASQGASHKSQGPRPTFQTFKTKTTTPPQPKGNPP